MISRRPDPYRGPRRVGLCLVVCGAFVGGSCRDHVHDDTDLVAQDVTFVADLDATEAFTAPADSTTDSSDAPRCLTVTDALVVISHVVEVRPGDGTFFVVSLANGHEFQVDASDARGQLRVDVLTSALEYDQAVYVELVENGTLLRELHLPYVSEVMEVRPTADGADVLLMRSAAIHRLMATSPCYAPYLELLEAAVANGDPVTLTETNDSHEIFDVRWAP